MIKVKWLKAHWDYAYSEGDLGYVSHENAPKLLKGGFVLPLPEEEIIFQTPVNPLPEDFPAREIIFNAGFDTFERIKEAGDSLLDVGISKTTLKKIQKYLEK
jgi:hypothetical protein